MKKVNFLEYTRYTEGVAACMVNYARKANATDLESVPKVEPNLASNVAEDDHEEFESISTIIQSKFIY